MSLKEAIDRRKLVLDEWMKMVVVSNVVSACHARVPAHRHTAWMQADEPVR
jgi:hypothetical protein